MTKPTFEEWMKSQKCNSCETPLNMSFEAHFKGRVHKLRDMDHEKVKGFYCSDCYPYVEANLMNERFVEVYRGRSIYCKDGNYSLWQSATYCKTLEDLRNWIDMRLGWIENAKKEWGVKYEQA